MGATAHFSDRLRGALGPLALSAALLGVAGGGSDSRAEEWSFLGPRYQAMGGAGVATVNDGHAWYWNPGAAAFSESQDVELPLNFAYTLEGETLAQIDEAADFFEVAGLGGVLAKMDSGQPLTTQELQDALDLVVRRSPPLGSDGDGFLTLPEAGLSFRRGRLSISVRGFGSLGVDPVLDLGALSFSDDIDAATQISNVVGAGADRSAQFTNPASQTLADTIALATAWTQDQAEELVYQGEQVGLDPSKAGVQSLVTRIAIDTATAGAADLSENQSGALVRGLLTQEVSVGYAHPLFRNRLGVGGSLRYIRGVSTSRLFRIQDIEDSKDLLDELTDFENEETTHRVGLDLGVMMRLTPYLRAGLVGRNLNSPDFALDGPDDFTLKPQVRAGLAYDLLPNWTLATDVDVTENESEVVDGFKSRIVSVGTEYRLPFVEFELALRAGAFANLASGAERAVTVTTGIGLRAGNLAFDLALGASPDLEEFEDGGSKLPRRVNVSAALRWIMEP